MQPDGGYAPLTPEEEEAARLAREEAAADAAQAAAVQTSAPDDVVLAPAGTPPPPTQTVSYPTADGSMQQGTGGAVAPPPEVVDPSYGQQVTPDPVYQAADPAPAGAPAQPAYVPESSAYQAAPPTVAKPTQYVPGPIGPIEKEDPPLRATTGAAFQESHPGASLSMGVHAADPVSIYAARDPGHGSQVLPTNPPSSPHQPPMTLGDPGTTRPDGRRMPADPGRGQIGSGNTLAPDRSVLNPSGASRDGLDLAASPLGTFFNENAPGDLVGRQLGLDPDAEPDMYAQFTRGVGDYFGDLAGNAIHGLPYFAEMEKQGAQKLLLDPFSGVSASADGLLGNSWNEAEDAIGAWGMIPRQWQSTADPISKGWNEQAVPAFQQSGTGTWLEDHWVAPPDAPNDAAVNKVDAAEKNVDSMRSIPEVNDLATAGMHELLANENTPPAVREQAMRIAGEQAAAKAGVLPKPAFSLPDMPDLGGYIPQVVPSVQHGPQNAPMPRPPAYGLSTGRGAPPQSTYHPEDSLYQPLAPSGRGPQNAPMPQPPDYGLSTGRGAPAQPAYIPESSAPPPVDDGFIARTKRGWADARGRAGEAMPDAPNVSMPSKDDLVARGQQLGEGVRDYRPSAPSLSMPDVGRYIPDVPSGAIQGKLNDGKQLGARIENGVGSVKAAIGRILPDMPTATAAPAVAAQETRQPRPDGAKPDAPRASTAGTDTASLDGLVDVSNTAGDHLLQDANGDVQGFVDAVGERVKFPDSVTDEASARAFMDEHNAGQGGSPASTTSDGGVTGEDNTNNTKTSSQDTQSDKTATETPSTKSAANNSTATEYQSGESTGGGSSKTYDSYDNGYQPRTSRPRSSTQAKGYDDGSDLDMADFIKDYDGDGKITSKDRAEGKKRFMAAKKKRGKKSFGSSSSPMSNVPYRPDSPIRTHVLQAIADSKAGR